MNEFAEKQPRLYGLVILLVGAFSLAFLRFYAREMGRISLALIFLASLGFTYGVQAMVFATTPSSLRKERGTAGMLFVVTALGCFGIWRWLHDFG